MPLSKKTKTRSKTKIIEEKKNIMSMIFGMPGASCFQIPKKNFLRVFMGFLMKESLILSA